MKRQFYNLAPEARFHSTTMPGRSFKYVTAPEPTFWQRVVAFWLKPIW